MVQDTSSEEVDSSSDGGWGSPSSDHSPSDDWEEPPITVLESRYPARGLCDWVEMWPRSECLISAVEVPLASLIPLMSAASEWETDSTVS